MSLTFELAVYAIFAIFFKGSIIAPQEPFYVEADKILLFLIRRKQDPLDGLLPAHQPGFQGVFHKLQGLLLNVGEAGFLQVTDHVGRHPEDPCDLIDLELPCFQELRLLRRDGDGRVFQPLLKHSDFVAVCRAPELTHPGIPHPLRVLDGSRMLQHTAWLRAICKKFGAVFLCGNGKADGVLCHRNGGE